MTALQVRSAFYDLLQNLANVTTSEQDVATRQRELDQANARMNNGLGAPADVLQAKTNLADSAVALSTARSAALDAQVALAQLMGINPRTPIVPASASELLLRDEASIEQLVTDAMNDRPDIKAAKEQVNAAVFSVAAARKGNLPRVDVAGALTGKGPNDPFTTEAAAYGVTVTWLFGDGGSTAGLVKEAKGNEEAARQTLISVTNQAIADVSQAFVDLQSAIQRFDLAQVGEANATELVRVDEGRYAGGIGQFLDVTTAQTALVAARRNVAQAQGDVQRARARLRVAAGRM
jgi:outer membrane protein TolC